MAVEVYRFAVLVYLKGFLVLWYELSDELAFCLIPGVFPVASFFPEPVRRHISVTFFTYRIVHVYLRDSIMHS